MCSAAVVYYASHWHILLIHQQELITDELSARVCPPRPQLHTPGDCKLALLAASHKLAAASDLLVTSSEPHVATLDVPAITDARALVQGGCPAEKQGPGDKALLSLYQPAAIGETADEQQALEDGEFWQAAASPPNLTQLFGLSLQPKPWAGLEAHAAPSTPPQLTLQRSCRELLASVVEAEASGSPATRDVRASLNALELPIWPKKYRYESIPHALARQQLQGCKPLGGGFEWTDGLLAYCSLTKEQTLDG